MQRFLTDNAEIIQTNTKGIWITAHNQLFQDIDGTINLVPRFFKTDGYTILDLLAPVAGGRFDEDLRCAIQHDWDCRYRYSIVVKLTEYELRKHGYYKTHYKQIGEERTPIMICEDIPTRYLKLIPIGFKATNAKFKRMVECVSWSEEVKRKVVAFAVNLNIGWFFSKVSKIDLKDIYKKIL
jgi:hypothetical protein